MALEVYFPGLMTCYYAVFFPYCSNGIFVKREIVMVEKNVVSISFADQSKAYQAFTELKNLSAAGAISVDSAAIVVRDKDGAVSFPDGIDEVTGAGFAGGGLVGMLVGVLGGPLGMLLGWGSGALIGGALDATRATATDEVVAEFSRALPVDSTAVIAEIAEPSEAAVNELVAQLGGTVIRRPVDEVVAELAAAEAAAEAAQAEAHRVMREKKREERKETVEEWWESVKSRFRRD